MIIGELFSAKTVALAIGGFGGGILRVITLRESFQEAAITITGAVLSVVFLGNPIGSWVITKFGLVDVENDVYMSVGFIVGMGGLTIAGLIVDGWKNPLKALDKVVDIVAKIRGALTK